MGGQIWPGESYFIQAAAEAACGLDQVDALLAQRAMPVSGTGWQAAS